MDELDEVAELYQKAEALNKEGRLEEAAAAFEEAIEKAKTSGHPDAAYRTKLFKGMLGTIYWKLGRYDLAKPCYQEVGQDMPRPPSVVLPIGRAIKALQKHGLLSELTPKVKKKIFETEDVHADDDGDMLVPILMAYYLYGDDKNGPPERTDGRVTPLTPRALKDGFLTYDHRFSNDSNDIAADLCDIIGGEPMFHLVECEFYHTPFVFVLGTKSGDKIPLEVSDIDDIIAFFNEQLASRGDPRRIISIETGSDFSAWYILSSDAFKDLCKKKVPALTVEATPGIDVAKWMKMKAVAKAPV